VGEVSDIGDESWRVADLVITVNDETDIDAEIEVDTIVRVDGVVMPNGQLLATRITSIDTDLGLSFSFVGPVQTIDAEVWLIANQFILVDETTEIDEDIEVGELVAVHGVIMPDGTWLAERIERVEADEATFTIIGQVEQIDPWVVAGISFEIQDWTVIEPDIVVGDLVRVRGTILPDGTWVADSIVLVEVDPTLNVIIFVGTVSSIDPWIVNNHPLEVDEDSLIIGDIEPGDLVWVRVEILADGTWLIKSIHLVDVEFGLGCFEVHAIVVSVTNTQIVLNHWQPIVLTDEIEVVGTLAPNTLINFYACFQPDGIIIIVGPIIVIGPIVIILPTPAPTVTPVPPVETGNNTICHRPPGNPDNAKTLNVGAGAVSAHLGHGDSLGPCPDGDGGKSNGKDKDKDKGKGNGKKNK
jgi:hypothetical protein